jgi:hypothetical protein
MSESLVLLLEQPQGGLGDQLAKQKIVLVVCIQMSV